MVERLRGETDMKRFLTGCFLIILAATSLVSAQSTPPAASQSAAPATPKAAPYTPPQKTSEEFSYCTYRAQSGEYSVLVYSWLALWREAEPFFPVVVAVGRQDSAAGLPAPLAAREAAPRTRHPVSDLLLPAPAARPLAA
jgi:hypothetical protein